MKVKTITSLELKEFRILKHIQISTDAKFNGFPNLSIIYKRKFSDDYKFSQPEAEDNSIENRISCLINEYPKQENYPNDRIDEIFFKAIKDVYPNTSVRNELIVFNVDLEKIEKIKNRKLSKGTIIFSPTLSDYSNLTKYVGRKFSSPVIEFNIYNNGLVQNKNFENFMARYQFPEEESLLDRIKQIEFD